MSAKIQSKHKVSRRLGVNLWGTPNSAFNTRPTRPGQHGKSLKKRRVSGYALHLQAKQRLQFFYGMNQTQFFNDFKKAYVSNQNVVNYFVGHLESRLDIIVFRTKWAPSIYSARQMVSHKHILVNGNLVTIPSYKVKAGDVISVIDDYKNNTIFKESIERQDRQVPSYYEMNNESTAVKFIKLPVLEEISFPFDPAVNLIVEFYSRKL